MTDISNRALATLLAVAVIISLGGTLVSLNSLHKGIGITGRAQNDIGNTSVTVTQALSIILQVTAAQTNTTINFGTGRVNTTTAGCAVLANMVARASDNVAAAQTNIGGCWADANGVAKGSPRGWILENNGNLNATINVRGPSNVSFFTRSGTAYPGGAVAINATVLKWRLNVSDGGCAVGPNSAWTEFSDNKDACSNLPFNEALRDDDIGFDVNITIPSDLAAGQYSNGTIEFYATQWAG